MIAFTAALRIWTSDDGSSHFMTVPEGLAGDVRAHAMLMRRGFGSVRVEARIDGYTWRTSIFPSKAGGYFLPVKIDVLRATGSAAGDELAVELELL